MILKTLKLFFFLLLVGSCGKRKNSHIVDIELPVQEPKLSAMFSLKKFHNARSVFVSHSKNILDASAYDLIDDATVKLYKDETLLTEFTWFEDSEKYHSPYYNTHFDSGDFEMEISAPGYETIRASQTLPQNAKILSVSFIDGDVNDMLEIEIEDEGMHENYYSIAVSAIGTTNNGNHQIEVYGHSDDPSMEKGWREEFFPDENFNGGKYTLRYIIDVDLESQFELNNGGSLNEFNVNVLSYSKDYYQFSTSLIRHQSNRDLPFVEPILVPTNWENGYGIFSVVNIEKFKLEL